MGRKKRISHGCRLSPHLSRRVLLTTIDGLLFFVLLRRAPFGSARLWQTLPEQPRSTERFAKFVASLANSKCTIRSEIYSKLRSGLTDALIRRSHGLPLGRSMFQSYTDTP